MTIGRAAALGARCSLAAVFFLEKRAHLRRARRVWKRLLNTPPAEETTLRALLRLADLSGRDGAAADARAWLDRAPGHPACSSEGRTMVGRNGRGAGYERAVRLHLSDFHTAKCRLVSTTPQLNRQTALSRQ